MTPTEPEWPDPQPDPGDEPGEDPETNLLPNRARWLRLGVEQRVELLETLDDWTGPAVERWRNEVASSL
jgi:hypothetical protein